MGSKHSIKTVFFPALLTWLTRHRPLEEQQTDVPAATAELLSPAPDPQPAVATVAATAQPPIAPSVTSATSPETTSLTPLPVTEEEIAALLDSAFLADHLAVSHATVELEPAESSASEPVRRRNLPRRSEAA